MKKQIDEKCKAQSGPFTNTVDKHSIIIDWFQVLEQIQFATAIEDGTGRPISPQGIQYYRSNGIRVFAGPILPQHSTFEE